MLKKILLTQMILCFLLPTIIYAELSINADAAILVDYTSGRVLYAKNTCMKRSVASTTKILTAIVVLEHGSLEDMVTVSVKAAAMGGSTLGLKAKEELSVRDLLYGLLLRSGNDAAVALAEHVGGSVATFAEMMTEKAHQIGALNSHFVNPHGLDQPEHYSTAEDIARITLYALGDDLFAHIVSTKEMNIDRMSGSYTQRLSNINRFLNIYPTAIGIKTGYTGSAGRCLVAAAEMDGQRLVAVVLNAANRYQECGDLIDYGFTHYTVTEIFSAVERMGQLGIHKGTQAVVDFGPLYAYRVPLREEELPLIRLEIDVESSTYAPIIEGQRLGQVVVWLDDDILGAVPLVAMMTIPKRGVVQNLSWTLRAWVDAFWGEGIDD